MQITFKEIQFASRVSLWAEPVINHVIMMIFYILTHNEILWSSFIILPIITVWKSHSFKTSSNHFLWCLHLRLVQTCLAETLQHINLSLCRLGERQMSSEHNGVESHSDILNQMGVCSWAFRSVGEGKGGVKGEMFADSVSCLYSLFYLFLQFSADRLWPRHAPFNSWLKTVYLS